MKKNFYTKTKALLLSCMLSAFSLNSMAADITTGRFFITTLIQSWALWFPMSRETV